MRKYEEIEIEIIAMNSDDVITTSFNGDEDGSWVNKLTNW